MQMNDNSDYYSRFVETVTGPIKLSKIGETLTHEHLSCDFTKYYESSSAKMDLYENTALKRIVASDTYPFGNHNNLCFNDSYMLRAAFYELYAFKKKGDKTIVENSSYGLNRNLPFLRKFSELNKINVIIGTGYYVAKVQEALTLTLSREIMYKTMYNELTEGIVVCYLDKSSLVQAAFIGEVGSNWPIHDFERRSILATGEVQSDVGCGVNLSPGINPFAPSEIMRLYQEAGGDPSKAIMSHVDRVLTHEGEFLEFVDDTKCYVQFDLFGTERSSSFQDLVGVYVLSDEQRINRIATLKEEGKLNRVLMSHDIHTKDRLLTFHGHGYCHIADNVVPQLLKIGFTRDDINLMRIENPKNWLSRRKQLKTT